MHGAAASASASTCDNIHWRFHSPRESTIFNDWDEGVAIVDTSWGTILNGISGALYFLGNVT